MLNKEQINKYSTYTTEDFLLDSFFISSIKNPEKETECFWREFTENNPSNINDFFQAKEIILAFKDDEALLLPETEVNEMLDNIMVINRKNKRNHTLRFRLTVAASIAACFLGMFFIYFGTEKPIDTQDTIISFVEKNSIVNLNDTTVKLIISDTKTITSQESEPAIAYHSEEIVLASEEISKEESAEYNQLIVPYGKRSRITLSDGTKIWVNAGTSLTYPVEFKNNKREIYVNGEVFLDVTPDAKRPFIVKTNNFDIRVLGTKFNVSTYEKEVNNVVLASGSVKISMPDKNQDILLSPSEMFQLEDGIPQKTTVNINHYISWINGVYIYENENLEAVMNRLSKYYGKDIQCSPRVANLKCSGKLDLKESLDEILTNLSFISSIKYRSQDNKYEVY